MVIGSKYNPCKNVQDVKKAIKTSNERIYVDGIMDIPQDIRAELVKKDIKLWVVSKNG